jgi:SAM-dependent methyltransferase
MHNEAYAWVAAHATTDPVTVLDIGGRNINGTVRPAFPAARFTILDIAPGDGVDIVANAAEWTPDQSYDVVTCSEVFEHTPDWRGIVETAYAALRPGGRFIATMAGPGRPPHSAVDGGWWLHPGEHYANIEPAELKDALVAAGFVDVEVDQQFSPCDVRAVATRPEVSDG